MVALYHMKAMNSNVRRKLWQTNYYIHRMASGTSTEWNVPERQRFRTGSWRYSSVRISGHQTPTFEFFDIFNESREA